jgi:hypothetical protein
VLSTKTLCRFDGVLGSDPFRNDHDGGLVVAGDLFKTSVRDGTSVADQIGARGRTGH